MSMMSFNTFVQVFHPYVPREGAQEYCLSDNDLGVLQTLVNRFRPQSFMEMGTFKGGTARKLLNKFSFITDFVAVDCSDPNREVSQPVDQIGILARGDPRYRTIVSDAGTRNPDVANERPDMVFVDAAHSFDWCVHDSRLAWRIVNEGGVVVWHDYHNLDGVTRAIHALNTEDTIIWVVDTFMCFEIVRDKNNPRFHQV